eukprot:COSAG01_NODE_1249_length_11069_cov_22.388332_6_plen_73_part_00
MYAAAAACIRMRMVDYRENRRRLRGDFVFVTVYDYTSGEAQMRRSSINKDFRLLANFPCLNAPVVMMNVRVM